jgi:hypothetical protein
MGAWGLAGLWWALAWASRRAAHRSRDEEGPETLVWMAVLSVFLGAGVEWANSRIGLWGWNGLPANEFARYLAQGAVFAAYVPALDGAARLLDRAPDARAVAAAARWAGVLGLALAACGLLGGEASILSPAAAFGALGLGLWLAADGANAARGQPSLLGAARHAAAWSGAGITLAGCDAAFGELLGVGRTGVSPDAPVLWEYLGWAFAGPAARSLYVFAAEALDLPFAGRSPRGRALLG